MKKYVSGRQKDLKVGISSYSETKKSLEVIGRVGVGTTSFDADAALDIRGDVILSGVTTLGSSGGITTTGGDFYVGGDLYVSDDIVYDEVTGRNINISGLGTIAELGVTGLTTSQFIEVIGIGTAAEWAVSGLTTSQFLKITGVSTFTGNVSAASSIWVGGDDGLRLSFYTDTPSTSSYLEDNTGSLYLQDVDGDIYIRAKRNQNSIHCTSDGSVDLYYSGDKKLETTNEGVLVSGGTTTPSLSVTGVSTLGTDSAVGGIKVGYGNTALIVEGDGRVTGILTVNTLEVLSGGAWGPDGDLTVTTLVGTALSISGISTFSGIVGFGTTATFSDDASVYFGDDEDLRIYHDGTHSYISNQGTGDIKVLSDTFILRNSADSKGFLETVNDAGVLLSYNDVKKLETTGAGITVTGLTSTTDLYVTGGTTANNFNVTGVSTLGSNVIVGGATTDLLVNGDCRITGILTVGTDSITIDGNTDVMNVGLGITMYASAGIISAQTLYVDEKNIIHEINTLVAGTGVVVEDEGTNVKGSGRFENINFVSGNLTASDFLGAGNTANITLTDTPVFDSLKINTSGISTFGGIIEAGAGVTVTGLTSTSQLYVTGVSTLGVVTDVTSIEATNFYGTLTGTASSAIQLKTPRSIALSGDVVASGTFDGTSDISLAAVIQANSVNLGGDTVGDYVQTISPGVAADGINVTNTSGEGVNATVQFGNKVVIPDEFGVIGFATVGSALTVFGDVTLGSNILKDSNDTTAVTLSGANATIAGDLTVDGDIKGGGGKAISFDSLSNVAIATNLHVGGNITVGGTSAYIVVDEFRVTDKDIVVGYTTDSNNDNVSNDITANGGGIAVASTIGNPLVDLTIAGVHTHPSTYKDFAWFKIGAFSGLNTDAWLSNYPIGIGSTQFPTGTRLVAGNVQVSEDDIRQVRHINASGIITASIIGDSSTTVFYGDGSNLDGLVVSPVFDNVTGGASTTRSIGIGTTAVDSNVSLNVVGTTTTTQLIVSDTIINGADPHVDVNNVGQRMAPTTGIVARSAGTNHLWRGYQTGGNVTTSEIKADGVGIFSGAVQSGNDPNPSSGTPSPGTKIADWGTVFACNAGTSSVFAGYTTGDSDPKILLYGKGLAHFKGAQFSGNVTPTAGEGVEIFQAATGVGVIQSYDRSNSDWDTLRIKGSQLEFFTEGTEKLTISTDGKVGIGITGGDGILDVKGTTQPKCRFRDSNGSNETGIYFEADNTSARIGSTYHAGQGGAFKPLEFLTSGSTKMSILADGNVGIGTSLTDDFGTNHRVVQIHSGSSTNSYLSLTNSTTGDQGAGVGLNLIAYGNDAVINNRSDGYMSFSTHNEERMRLHSDGYMLVGTDDSRIVEDRVGNGPQGKIQIEAEDSKAIMSIISAGTSDANRCGTLSLGRHRNQTIGGTPTIVQDNDALGAIIFSAGNGSTMRTAGASIHAEVDGTPSSTSMPGALIFATTAANAVNATERMRISSAGVTTFPGSVKIGGTADANEMDEYEEGTWTPVFSFKTNQSGSFTYNGNHGSYTKIGRLVTATIFIYCSAIPTAGNDLAVTLPFTPADTVTGTTADNVGACIAYNAAATGGAYAIATDAGSGGGVIVEQGIDGGSGTGYEYMDKVDIDSDFAIRATISYGT